MSARVSKAVRCSARYSHAIRRRSVISSTLAEHQKVRSMTWKKTVTPCHLIPEHLIEHSIGQFTPVGSSNMHIIVGLSTHVAHVKKRRRLNHTQSCGVRGVNVLPGIPSSGKTHLDPLLNRPAISHLLLAGSPASRRPRSVRRIILKSWRSGNTVCLPSDPLE